MHRFITYLPERKYFVSRIVFRRIFRQALPSALHPLSIQENNKDHEINLIDARDYLLSVIHMSRSSISVIDKRIEQRVSSVRVSIRLRASEYDVVFERYRMYSWTNLYTRAQMDK